jgi:hypothetical protein
MNTFTNTVTETPTNTPTNTVTNTSTNSPTVTPTNTITNTPTITATQTITNTLTITPTFTNTPIPTFTPIESLSNLGRAVLGPVPVPRGGNLCLFPDKPINSTVWDVYNLKGEFVAHLEINSTSQPCWTTVGVPPGLYLVRLNLTYSDGTTGTVWQKVVLAR